MFSETDVLFNFLTRYFFLKTIPIKGKKIKFENERLADEDNFSREVGIV